MPVPQERDDARKGLKEEALSMWKFEPLKDKVLHGAALLHVARALPRRTEHIDIVGKGIDHPLVKGHDIELLLEPVKYVLNRNGICVVLGKDMAEVVVDKIEATLLAGGSLKHTFDIGYLYAYDRYRMTTAVPAMLKLLKLKFGAHYRKRLADFIDLIPYESAYFTAFPEALRVLESNVKRYRKSISMSAIQFMKMLRE